MSERINVDPSIHHGVPVIKGTRVPVAIIIGGLAGGMSKEDVAREYEIEIADVEAAISTQPTVAEIESAIERLPSKQLLEISSWLQQHLATREGSEDVRSQLKADEGDRGDHRAN